MKKVNTSALRKRAIADTRKKIKLEPHLARDMKTILRRIVKHFQISYPINHDTDVPQSYKSDVTTALRNHYRRVTKAFISYGDDIVNLSSTKRFFNRLRFKKRDKRKANVDHKLTNYIASHSEKQATLIIKTTQGDLHDEISRTIADAARTGTPIDSKRIADAVASSYIKKVNGRAKIISQTETQSIAEKTKDVDLQAASDIPDDADASYARVWVAILDDKTRDWHAEADGIQAEAGEPFIVMGEELDYPGDPSGSPENIINCRCASIPVQV